MSKLKFYKCPFCGQMIVSHDVTPHMKQTCTKRPRRS